MKNIANKYTVDEETLEGYSLKQLANLYNEFSETGIKRFADKKSAVRRTWELVGQFEVKKPTNRMRFNFVPDSDWVARKPRKGSMCAMIVDLLTEGGTFEEVMEIVKKWNESVGRQSKNVENRTYHAIRGIHYRSFYGIEHDTETGVIKLYQGRKSL